MKHLTQTDLMQAAKAAAEVTGQTNFVIVGMASTVFTLPAIRAPFGDQVGLFTPDTESKTLDALMTALGIGSSFHKQHGFSVACVGSETLRTRPSGWVERAFRVSHPSLTLHALHPLDLLYSLLESAQKTHRESARRILRDGDILQGDFELFLRETGTPEKHKQHIRRNLEAALRKPSVQPQPF